MNEIQLSMQLGFSALFFLMAITFDLSRQKIPNKLTLIAVVIGFSLNAYFSQMSGIITALFGFSLAFLILFPTFIFRILGAGDIKLMMGIGALMGPQLLLWSLAYGIVAGTVTSVALVIWKTGFNGIIYTLKRYWDCIYMRKYFAPEEGEAAGQRVPYAPALALGWLWACSLDPAINNLYVSYSHYISS
ncbi:prepilin peptidase [Shewanella sp. KX20019]|uniref:A24 family peptidase n=1 Tax=Shewanella sp. KX20019 TaxID=2803864 RepID=UPI0019268DDB|nr:A24 family peptidase [Shewanella sp. KX20019]QQX82302.1 prepilin peptidase [Shewanella sp. KX20019]